MPQPTLMLSDYTFLKDYWYWMKHTFCLLVWLEIHAAWCSLRPFVLTTHSFLPSNLETSDKIKRKMMYWMLACAPECLTHFFDLTVSRAHGLQEWVSPPVSRVVMLLVNSQQAEQRHWTMCQCARVFIIHSP